MTDEKDLDQPVDENASVDGSPVDESAASSDAEAGAAMDDAAAQQADGGEPELPSDSADLEAAAAALDEVNDSADAVEDPMNVVNDDDVPEDEAEAAMLAMLNDLPDDDSQASADDIDFGTAEVSKAEFQHLQEPAGGQGAQNIDLLMDVDLPVSIELGRTKLSISDILALGPGSVVELNKLAGEPVDLMVNNKAVAKGEVVVVDENFGLRITQLMTPEERLKSLGKD